MCIQNVDYFLNLKLNNLLSKQSLPFTLLLLVHAANNWECNTMYRNCITCTEGKISGEM